MPGDAFKKVNPGQPLRIPAEAWNAMLDVVARSKGDSIGLGGQGFTGADSVLVRNDSGSDVDRFGVLEVDGPLILPSDNLDEFQRQTALSGITPSGTDNAVLAILWEPAADGEIARATMDGLAVVQVDVTDAGHGYADANTGDTANLLSQAAASPQQILWKESGTGTKWALVRMGAPGGAGGSIPDATRSVSGKVNTSNDQRFGGWKVFDALVCDTNYGGYIYFYNPADANYTDNYGRIEGTIDANGSYLTFKVGKHGYSTYSYAKLIWDDTNTTFMLASNGSRFAVVRSNVQVNGADGSFVFAGAGADAGKTITVTVYGGIITGISKV